MMRWITWLWPKRAETLIAELKEQFDYIIIDAPPVGIVTDAQLLNV
ncbi:CpsD/CapB family tyrosine-protein kinase [Mucilaginibacter hurinus]|nr:CpsD/CapB family tyrosine-protein kinase [Mucilaginibacter hurinus]